MKSNQKPALKLPVKALQPAPPEKSAAEQIELLLTQLGALQKKVAPIVQQAKPYWDQMDEIRTKMAELTLASGAGKGATKTIESPDGTKVKVSPVVHYKMTQDEYQQMLCEFPDDEDAQARAMSVIRWKPELNKKVYNTFIPADQERVNKFLTSTPGKLKFEIIRPGEKSQGEDEE